MNLTTYISTIERKGYLKYKYNPFHNYQTDVDLHKISTDVGDVLVPKGKAVKNSTGEILTEIKDKWVDKKGNIIDDSDVILTDNSTLYARAGSLIDFTTDLLNFDLKHPVDITVQPSYDGSVNLILNDGKNIPRLINSRFSAREKNTYEIVDRIGENDTNIYNSTDFDKDSSLYFRYSVSPKVRFSRLIGGNLLVGQYCFYFTYCDADDNESDIIAETGLIPVFIGNNQDPFSMDGGIKNLNSNKGISLRLIDVDKSYNYIKIYLFRYFADYQQNRVYECKKIYHKYPIEKNLLYVNITGYEEGEMIDANLLNISTFNPKSVLAQAQCKNMLFFGNIVKNTDNYKELIDCALRIYPTIYKTTLKDVDIKYKPVDNSYCYYDINNIYNKTGYFPEEYYRFGVVFIYSNGTLSNVYNTLGFMGDGSEEIIYNPGLIYDVSNSILTRKYIVYDENGWIAEQNNTVYTNLPPNTNSKGVIKMNSLSEYDYDTDNNDDNHELILGIKFNIPNELIAHLKSLNITGLFFVRQKRIPTIISLLYLMPFDKELQTPILLVKTEDGDDEYFSESFINQTDRLLTLNYKDRLITYDNNTLNISKIVYSGICPDFLLNLPYYNQIFNGSNFKVEKVTSNSLLNNDDSRNYYMKNSKYHKNNLKLDVRICTVTENVPTIAIKDQIYRLEVGKAEEAYRFRYAREDTSSTDNAEKATNIVRGIYSPYLAIYSESELETGCLYNIYIEKESNYKQEFENRINSSDPFYAISDRLSFDDLVEESNFYTTICFRGDCYLNTFTYRLNRNFNDSSLPNNDKIILEDTWRENYSESNKKENWQKISRSDINAVKLGSWITIKCRSSMNYALRSNDGSFVSENAIMGSERSFYPRSSLLEAGENKRPDSYLYNDAYRATLGFKCYFTLDNINYLKDNFSNRIQYSSISILDSYKNNFRHSLTTYFRDYSQEYGSILKLVGFEGYLLVVFEHAICIAVINERILAGQSDGEPVFINTHNVLPEELTVISDTYGTQWPESVVKSEAGYVYGVDTVAKKIWRVKGLQIEILSDFKVGKFLNNNINLSERDKTPIIGLRNVKTHYNNNKKDVMFTFYNNIYKDEEKAWNLCYNELLGEFITFYSWIPSYSENIDTQFFSFDRNTSKCLSLLNKCNANIPENTGILLDTPIIQIGTIGRNEQKTIEINLTYVSLGTGYVTTELDGILYHESSINTNTDVNYILEKDHWKNYKLVSSISNGKLYLTFNYGNIEKIPPVILLEITPYKDNIYFPTETIAIGIEDKITSYKTDFYLHGNSGIIDCQEDLYPTYWYGEFHPFEFEIVVNDKIAQLKIFTDLVLISNKAEPESFHFEIEGDNYLFSPDKRTMYFRLEATKNLYLNLGSDILYDRYFTDVAAKNYTYELYYRGDGKNPYDGTNNNYSSYLTNNRFNWDRAYPVENKGLVQLVKSTIFPLYYNRVDTYNEIYYDYTLMSGQNYYDFKNLSGSEILWDRTLNLFNIVTHIKNSPIDKFGRMRGNSYYKEGKWNIQIPSILFCLSNEYSNGVSTWKTVSQNPNLTQDGPLKNFVDTNLKIPPIIINSATVPSGISTQIGYKDLPDIYYTDGENWKEGIRGQDQKWTARKEAKIRDKWIKIRVRYSGRNLAVIHSLLTLYNISYS